MHASAVSRWSERTFAEYIDAPDGEMGGRRKDKLKWRWSMKIKIKNPMAQLLCRHEYKHFETPIDRKTNPFGFVSLNNDPGILVCVKCGKRKDR